MIKDCDGEDRDSKHLISHRALPRHKEESKVVRDSSKGDNSLETAAQSMKSSATNAGLG